jgi:hypothetical protein
MNDIILKLDQKKRRYKITSKKKLIEDALCPDSNMRQASVYVVVVSREKNYDPTLNRKRLKKRISGLVPLRPISKVDESSSTDNE